MSIMAKWKSNPEGSRKLIDAVIGECVPRFAPGADILYVGDTKEKFAVCNTERLRKLAELFSTVKSGIVYVTAFPNRTVMARYLGVISWETEVWVADAPDHLIHFDGERFLGPYETSR